MNTRAGHITVVHTACACALLLAVGCTAPLMLEYQDQFTRYRIDNPDGDNLWDTGDLNGNGTIDENESYGSSITFPSVTNITANTVSSAPRPAPQPNRGFNVVEVTFRTPPGLFDGFRLERDNTIEIVPIGIDIGIDFDDLHTFSFRFDLTDVWNRVEMRGMQVVRGLRFSNLEKDKRTSETEHSFEISAGAQYFRLQDHLTFAGFGNVLGGINSDTSMDNTSVGPQIGAKWYSGNDKWNLNAAGSFMMGYHDVDGVQIGQVGQSLVPGGINRLVTGAPTRSFNNQQENEFSPLGEFQASASYQVSESMSFRLGYIAFYMGNLRYAEDSVEWQLPNMGIVNSPGRNTSSKTLYANIELTR